MFLLSETLPRFPSGLVCLVSHPGKQQSGSTVDHAQIWQGVGRVFDAVRSLLTLPLKLRPTGLGSGIDKDRLITPSSLASARSAAFTRPAAVPTVCAGQGRSLRALIGHNNN